MVKKFILLIVQKFKVNMYIKIVGILETTETKIFKSTKTIRIVYIIFIF